MDKVQIEEIIRNRSINKNILFSCEKSNFINNLEKIFIVGPPRSGTTLVNLLIAGENFLPECTFISTLLRIFDEMLKYSDDKRFNYFADNLNN